MDDHKGEMTSEQILQAIPHRYPFVFVDGILENHRGEYVVGFKNVSHNEYYLYGVKGGKPRFPESLITECMAQVGAVAVLSEPENRGKIMLFASVENLRFHHPVFPGDRLVSEVTRVYVKGNLGKMKATAAVENRLVAEGEFSYALADKAADS